MAQLDTKRIALRLEGHVQGVGFRWFVVSQAQRLGVRGSVRNTRDGSVEVRAEGQRDAIVAFRRSVERGPPAARVTRVVELAPPEEELPDGFEISR